MQVAFTVLWAAFAVSWILAARWSGQAAVGAPLASTLPYRALQIAGFGLLFGANALPQRLALPLWSLDQPALWAMAALTAAGFGVCWWARLHLGANWSSSVQRKTDHAVVDTGPYRLVRHPIYTGALLAAFATMVATGRLASLLGWLLIVAAFTLKARLEEQLLSAELGPRYATYAARTPMLIPRLSRSGTSKSRHH